MKVNGKIISEDWKNFSALPQAVENFEEYAHCHPCFASEPAQKHFQGEKTF